MARGRIDIEGGVLPLAMPVEAKLIEVTVRDGDTVSAGQVIARGDPSAAVLDERTAIAHRDQARARTQALVARGSHAREHWQRLRAAAAAGAGDGQSADDAEATMRESIADAAAAHADEELAATELSRSRYRRDQLVLRAPVDADVVRIGAGPGAFVTPQSGPVAVLLPRAPRIIRAELAEAYATSVQIGAAAEILLDDGAQTRVGSAHLQRKAASFGPSTAQDEAGMRIGERSLECVLTFDAPTELKVGQRVLVRFTQRSTVKRPGVSH